MSNAATDSASVRGAVNRKPEIDVLLLIGVPVLRHRELAAALATPGEAALNGRAASATTRHTVLSAIATLGRSRQDP